ncbi:hypothetical protein POTOM_027143 [Populus tomentosa]|uniref:Uncharacterized protein n=1 Tax=Populus tomentosa TaxID=118781 RepID=A0A8X8CMB3_POPTO|nr:hypothetical protein POTOM_027143 [Populus tomentosa]
MINHSSTRRKRGYVIEYMISILRSLPRATRFEVSESILSMLSHVTTPSHNHASSSKDNLPLICRRRVKGVVPMEVEETPTTIPSVEEVCQKVAGGIRSPISRGPKVPTPALVILEVSL